MATKAPWWTVAIAAAGLFLAIEGCQEIAGINGIEYTDICKSDGECDDANICTTDMCGPNGVCVYNVAPDGVFPDGVTGNCTVLRCSEGVQAEIQLTDDVDDGDDCTKDVCTDTGATHDPDIGATCHLGGGFGKCDADKKCVIECGYKDENGSDVGCPKSDDACTISYCDDAVGQCVLHKLDGVAVPGTSPADCGGSYCIKGKTTTSASLADTPCMDTTPDGQPATVCDGTGECVECNSDEQCNSVGIPPSFCFTPKCNANKCENVFKDNVDLPLAQQSPSDCQIKRCDMGLVVSVADDSDKPNDNDNLCTFDICTNGVPSNPPVPAGTDCGTGAGGNPLACNAVGVCVGCNSPQDCQGTDDECKARTCLNQECGVAYTPNDTLVAAQTDGDCVKQVCNGAGSIVPAQDYIDVPADDGNQCTDEVCTNGTPGHPNKSAGSACNDANGCTQSDTCQAGACIGSNPVTCMALDQCHDVGVCNPASGMCSNPNKANGTACTDSNQCTQTDSCQSGACVGAMPVVCTALDQCHNVGTCNMATGVCSNPNKPNNAACSDSNACTQTDSCQSGSCVGAMPVVCTALDQCHNAGACNMATGMCSSPNKANGAVCTDGNACTLSDTCQSGACLSGTAITCAALDQCHNAGTCSPATGMCSNPNKANGSACNDSDQCTQTDICQSGTCTGANPVVCTPNQCQTGGTCNPANGTCSFGNKADATSCSDMNACTTGDACQNGACISGSPVVCSPLDQCHDAGTCNMGTGVCSNPVKSNGTACNDSDSCTITESCQVGVCSGATFLAEGAACVAGAVSGHCTAAHVCMAP